jgi:uncharacterized protein YyaL (SSP411 family)
VYLHAWQLTGRPLFREIVEEILDYVIREMVDPLGGFYSTQDADSEGIEGQFFVWTPAAVRAVLGDEADAFLAAYGVEQAGNFEGKSVLEYVADEAQRATYAEARRDLRRAREARTPPQRDEKVITSWNGLMMAAFAEAARALGRDDYQEVACQNASFLLREMMTRDGRLQRTWSAGEAKLNAYLEDYSFLAEGLLELYQTTFDPRWFEAARGVTESILAHFRVPKAGFFDTSDDHEALVTRPRNLQDNATPSGSAMATTVLLKLAGLANAPHYSDVARDAIAAMQSLMAEHPLGFGQWLQALQYTNSHPKEIAIIGDPTADDTASLLGVVQGRYDPFHVLAVGAPPGEAALVPLLAGRGQLGGRATAYVCVDHACQQPVLDPDELARILEE